MSVCFSIALLAMPARPPCWKPQEQSRSMPEVVFIIFMQPELAGSLAAAFPLPWHQHPLDKNVTAPACTRLAFGNASRRNRNYTKARNIDF